MSLPENTALDIIEDSAQQTNILSTIGLSMDYDRMHGSPLGPPHLRGTMDERVPTNRQPEQQQDSPSQKGYSLFPNIESIAHFKHHLNMTLSKLRDPLTVPQAKEELHELMTEHIINTDRMNTFLAALSGLNNNISTQGGSGGTSQLITSEKNRRKEMIKVYGEAAEIFEESLITFVPKIVQYFQKILKETETLYHMPVAQSLGRLVFYVVQKIEHEDDRLDQTKQILRTFYQNMQVPNQTLQIGSALCIKQVISSVDPVLVRRLALSTAKQITDSIKSKYCKSQKNLIECLEELVSIREADSPDKIPVALKDDKVDQTQIMDILIPCLLSQGSNLDSSARKEAIKCLTVVANGIEKKEQLASYKDDILSLLHETKCDKAKPVREATNEALAIYRQIDAMFVNQEEEEKQNYKSRDVNVNPPNTQKELTLGSPDSQIAMNFYRSKESTDHLLGSRPMGYVNVENQDLGLLNNGKNDASQRLLSNLTSKILSPQGQVALNEVNSQTFSGTLRMNKQAQGTDSQQHVAGLDLQEVSLLDKKMQEHQKRVQELQATEQAQSSDFPEQLSSVRTVIQQIDQGETTGKSNELPPRSRISGAKNSTAQLSKGQYFEHGARTQKPMQRTNSSQQKFSHLKISLSDGVSPANTSERNKKVKSRPSTTRNNGSRLSARNPSHREVAPPQIQSGRKNPKIQRSSSFNNYMSRGASNDEGSAKGVVTGKLSLATRKKLENKQREMLKQHPHSALNKTVPQRNARVDWKEQAQKNRQSIFQGPRNKMFFVNKGAAENDAHVEIFAGPEPEKKHASSSDLQHLMLENSQSPNSKEIFLAHGQSSKHSKGIGAGLHDGISTQQNSQTELQTRALLGLQNQQSNSNTLQNYQSKDNMDNSHLEEFDNDNEQENSFLSNFGRVYQAENIKKRTSIHDGGLGSEQQNFVIERRKINENSNNNIINRKNMELSLNSGLVFEPIAYKEQSNGQGPRKDTDFSAHIKGSIESQKFERDPHQAMGDDKARVSKIVCDEDYQNFRGSNLYFNEMRTRQDPPYMGRHTDKIKSAQDIIQPAHTTGGTSAVGPFQPKENVQSNHLTPEQQTRHDLKNLIVLRQMNTDYGNQSVDGGHGLGQVPQYNENLIQHARMGSGDHKIIGDNSFSLNSDFNQMHNLTQQEVSKSNVRASPDKFNQLRQAQMDFNKLQYQRTNWVGSSMTQTNNSVKNQVVDDFSISCFRQSQSNGGVDNSAHMHRKVISSIVDPAKHIVHEEVSEEHNKNLPTTMESGNKQDNVMAADAQPKTFNENIMSEQNTHSASYGYSNQPTPRYPEPSAGKPVIPQNVNQFPVQVMNQFEVAGTANNTQQNTLSSREHASTIHDIDLKADSFVNQIMQEVQVLRDENKFLKDQLLRLEDQFTRKQAENEVRIKALETLFLENRVPSHIQSIEPPDDIVDVANSSKLGGRHSGAGLQYQDDSINRPHQQHTRTSNMSNQFSHRRSTRDEHGDNSANRLGMSEYLNGGIDLANKKLTGGESASQVAQAQQQPQQSIQNNESMISTRRAQEKQADANQVVDLALASHNVSFLYKLMDNPKKFSEISPENLNRLLQFTFQKLTLQKGRHRLSSARRDGSASRQNSNDRGQDSRRDMKTPSPSGTARGRSFVVDHGLVDSLLLLTMKIIDIHMPLGTIDMNSTVFLDLIQLFIDLLKEDSILTSLQKIKLQQIYEKIEKQF